MAMCCSCNWKFPCRLWRARLQVARSRGTRVVLNPAPAQPLDAALLKHVDVLVPNQSELGSWTNMAVESVEDVTAAAFALRAMGVANVIVTLERGRAGA